MAANSPDPGPILPNSKPIQDFIAVLATCKNVDDRIKNEGARVLTTLYTQLQKKPIGHYLGQIWKNN